MREEDLLKALETLGLTGKEAQAYRLLLQEGISTAQRVSHLLGVQYPAVYRILQALQSKGWIEVSQERPNKYRARAPRIVAEEARQSRADDLVAAAEAIGSLEESIEPKNRDPGGDLWIYKGAEHIGRKLREIVLASKGQVLCASPFPVAPEVLRLVVDALGRSRRPVRLALNEANRKDVTELSGLIAPNLRVQMRFPERPLPATRLAHTFLFPNDEQVFILNSFYRDGALVADRLQGLWVGDADFVRMQLEAMLEDLDLMTTRIRRRLPSRP